MKLRTDLDAVDLLVAAGCGFNAGMAVLCFIWNLHTQTHRSELIQYGYGHYVTNQSTGISTFELVKPEDFRYTPTKPQTQEK